MIPCRYVCINKMEVGVKCIALSVTISSLFVSSSLSARTISLANCTVCLFVCCLEMKPLDDSDEKDGVGGLLAIVFHQLSCYCLLTLNDCA